MVDPRHPKLGTDTMQTIAQDARPCLLSNAPGYDQPQMMLNNRDPTGLPTEDVRHTWWLNYAAEVRTTFRYVESPPPRQGRHIIMDHGPILG